jgi:hypothetical protein
MPSAATGSAHHQPQAAFRPTPASVMRRSRRQSSATSNAAGAVSDVMSGVTNLTLSS